VGRLNLPTVFFYLKSDITKKTGGWENEKMEQYFTGNFRFSAAGCGAGGCPNKISQSRRCNQPNGARINVGTVS
jgi:hypothetical protein